MLLIIASFFALTIGPAIINMSVNIYLSVAMATSFLVLLAERRRFSVGDAEIALVIGLMWIIIWPAAFAMLLLGEGRR